MLARLGGFSVRRRRLILVLAGVLFVVSGVLGGGVAKELSNGGFSDESSESARAEHYIEDNFKAGGTPNIILLVTADPGTTVDSPEITHAGLALTDELAHEPHMGFVASYWSTGGAPPLKTTTGSRALVLARYDGTQDELNKAMKQLTPRYTRHTDGIDVRVGGVGEIFREVGATIEHDLLRAEMIAIPITLVLLVVVFGSVIAASLPLAIGGLSIVGTFLVLLILNKFTEVSIFALNMTTAMGLGLAIDYSLFIVSRYREELRGGHEPNDAVIRTVRTAGRTVAFSASTVAASLLALLVFPLAFLKSFAYAGVAVALLAGVYAVVVLPAILAVLGTRVDKLALWKRKPKTTEEGFWHGMAVRVMRRPVPFATGAILLLLWLGAPALGMQIGLPDDRVVPESKPTRQLHDIIRNEFPSEEAGTLSVVAPGVDPATHTTDIDSYATTLVALPGVERVDAVTGTYLPGLGKVLDASANPALFNRFVGNGSTYLNVVPSVEPLSEQGEALAKAVRNTAAPFKVEVGGSSAQLVDTKSSLFSRLPLAIAIIVSVIFVVLFLMFGSIVVPAKAVVLNFLSLSATFGAMVWVFQEGHFSGVLNFTTTGFLDATTPILMFCIAFGLSMDFEVFLLSRIKEEHDAGSDNVRSVALGLERTGRIVTAAAGLISVVFLAFATSEVSFIKLFGIGLTLAVMVDAYVIRGTLVPAFMRLAGEVNWWAPGPLRRLHARIGITEHVVLDEPAPAPAPIPEPMPQRARTAVPTRRSNTVNGRPRRTEPLRAQPRDKMRV